MNKLQMNEKNTALYHLGQVCNMDVIASILLCQRPESPARQHWILASDYSTGIFLDCGRRKGRLLSPFPLTALNPLLIPLHFSQLENILQIFCKTKSKDNQNVQQPLGHCSLGEADQEAEGFNLLGWIPSAWALPRWAERSDWRSTCSPANELPPSPTLYQTKVP